MGKPARVLYVHHGSGQGGAANSLLFLLQNLDRDRYEPIVACNFRAPESETFFADAGFPPVDLPVAPFVHTTRTWSLHTPRGFAKAALWLVAKQPAARKALGRLLSYLRPDIVHLNGLTLLPLARTCRVSGSRVVQHVRESVNDGYFGIRRAWLRRLSRRDVDHIIYICRDGRDRFGGRSETSSVIYNPIEFSKFAVRPAADARRDLEVPQSHPILFFPGGSLFDIKGILPFLNALAVLRRSHPGLLAIVPGIETPPHPRDSVRNLIEATIESQGLQEAILRLPFTTNVEDYYAAATVVVAPFTHPHFSRAVIEAGAMSRPVVASRIGGITEILEDGKAGLLAAPGDAANLAEKIRVLLDDDRLAADMGRTGLETARDQFSASDHSRAVMEVYDSLKRGGASDAV